MRRLLVIFILLFSHTLCYSQGRDFIRVQKKNGKTLKTFVAGSSVIFQLRDNDYVNGSIENIQDDSLYVRIYNRQFYVSAMGFNVVDTVSIYLKPFHYKEIKRVKIYYRRRFIRSKLDRIFLIGGAIYFVTNIINGVYHKQPIADNDNLKRLGLSVAAMGAGIVMRKKIIDVDNHFSKRRHRILYIHMD